MPTAAPGAVLVVDDDRDVAGRRTASPWGSPLGRGATGQLGRRDQPYASAIEQRRRTGGGAPSPPGRRLAGLRRGPIPARGRQEAVAAAGDGRDVAGPPPIVIQPGAQVADLSREDVA